MNKKIITLMGLLMVMLLTGCMSKDGEELPQQEDAEREQKIPM